MIAIAVRRLVTEANTLHAPSFRVTVDAREDPVGEIPVGLNCNTMGGKGYVVLCHGSIYTTSSQLNVGRSRNQSRRSDQTFA